MFKTYSMELAGRTLTLETGKMAGLANGSVVIICEKIYSCYFLRNYYFTIRLSI